MDVRLALFLYSSICYFVLFFVVLFLCLDRSVTVSVFELLCALGFYQNLLLVARRGSVC